MNELRSQLTSIHNISPVGFNAMPTWCAKQIQVLSDSRSYEAGITKVGARSRD
jgi:hypothetical protein